jgi:hypothetical protein
LVKNKKFGALRTFVRESVPKEEYEELIRLMYDGLKLAFPVNDPNNFAVLEECLITLNEYQVKHGLVAIPELNMEATIISLGKIANA